MDDRRDGQFQNQSEVRVDVQAGLDGNALLGYWSAGERPCTIFQTNMKINDQYFSGFSVNSQQVDCTINEEAFQRFRIRFAHYAIFCIFCI